jgi:hypothetical protein
MGILSLRDVSPVHGHLLPIHLSKQPGASALRLARRCYVSIYHSLAQKSSEFRRSDKVFPATMGERSRGDGCPRNGYGRYCWRSCCWVCWRWLVGPSTVPTAVADPSSTRSQGEGTRHQNQPAIPRPAPNRTIPPRISHSAFTCRAEPVPRAC